MATLNELLARRDQLDKLIASGVDQARQGDNSTTLRSLSDLRKTRALVDEQIDELSGTTRRRVRYAYQSSKGL